MKTTLEIKRSYIRAGIALASVGVFTTALVLSDLAFGLQLGFDWNDFVGIIAITGGIMGLLIVGKLIFGLR